MNTQSTGTRLKMCVKLNQNEIMQNIAYQPNVDSATPKGIRNAIGPNILLPNSTATAGAVIISLQQQRM